MLQSGVSCCSVAAENIAQLEHNVSVAQAFQPLAAKDLAAIEQRTAAIWEDGTFVPRLDLKGIRYVERN